jgi:hypothetical protein
MSVIANDTRTIVTHPASTTHSKLSVDERLAVSITDGLVRVSVGLETVKDVIADLNKLWLRFVINDFDCRFGNKIFTLIQQTQIAIDAFKENKIRNQS